MLGMVLKLFRPSYALTALILFGSWQGYSFVKSVPEKLSLPFGTGQVQTAEETQAAEQSGPVQVEQTQAEQTPISPTVAAIQRIHPGMRVLSWLVIYALLCFATVPLIKKMLAKESNLVNAILIIIYSGIGFLLAFAFTAFQFGWWSAIMLIVALVFSVCIIVWLSSELEKIRVRDTLSSS